MMKRTTHSALHARQTNGALAKDDPSSITTAISKNNYYDSGKKRPKQPFGWRKLNTKCYLLFAGVVLAVLHVVLQVSHEISITPPAGTAAPKVQVGPSLQEIVQENQKANQKIAYAFFLGGVPTLQDNNSVEHPYPYIPALRPYNTTKPRLDDYRGLLYNILVSIRTLQSAGSRADFMLLVQMADPRGTAELPRQDVQWLQQAVGNDAQLQIKYIPPPPFGLVTELSTVTFEKLRLLECHEYARILYVEAAHVTPKGNLDYLMEVSIFHNNNYAMKNMTNTSLLWLRDNIVVSRNGSPVSSDIFVLQPHSGNDFLDLASMISKSRASNKRGGHQQQVQWGGRPPREVTYYTALDVNGTKQYGDAYDFLGAHSDAGVLLEWTKYIQKDVSIIVGAEIENWQPAPSNVTMDVVDQQYPGRLSEMWTVFDTENNQEGDSVLVNQHMTKDKNPLFQYSSCHSNDDGDEQTLQAPPYCDLEFWWNPHQQTPLPPWNVPMAPLASAYIKKEEETASNSRMQGLAHPNSYYARWFDVLRQLDHDLQMGLGLAANDGDNANHWKYIPSMTPPGPVFHSIWSHHAGGMKALRQWALRIVDNSKAYLSWEAPVVAETILSNDNDDADIRALCQCPNVRTSDVCSSSSLKSSVEDWLSRRVPYYLSAQRPLCPRAVRHDMYVVIPFYNTQQKDLRRSVCSVACQDYPADKISILLYDDGSSSAADDMKDYCKDHDVVEFEPLISNKDEDVMTEHVRKVFQEYSNSKQSDNDNDDNNKPPMTTTCIRSKKHLGGGGTSYYALRFVEKLAKPNDVVVLVEDGDLSDPNALDIINDKYVSQGAFTTYGSSNLAASSAPLPRDVTTGETEFRPRKSKIRRRMGPPFSFKAHLLQQVSLEDFTSEEKDVLSKEKDWLVKQANDGFFLRMLEKSGVDRVGYIPEPIFTTTSYAAATVDGTADLKTIHRKHIGSLDESKRMDMPLHLVMIPGTVMELLSDQLVWLQEQTLCEKRKLVLHLLFNDAKLQVPLQEVVNQFRKLQRIAAKTRKKVEVKLAALDEQERPLDDFSRLVYARALRRQVPLEGVVFLDSDQYWPPDYLHDASLVHKPKSMASWSGKTYSRQLGQVGVEFVSEPVSEEEEKTTSFTYSAASGALFDANLFLFDGLFRLEKDLTHMVDASDVWTSYVMDALLGWQMHRVVSTTIPLLNIGSLHEDSMAKESLPSGFKERIMMLNKALMDSSPQNSVSKPCSECKSRAFTELQQKFHWHVSRGARLPKRIRHVPLHSPSNASTSVVAPKSNSSSRRAFVCVTGEMTRLEVENKIKNLFSPMQDAGFDLDVALVVSASPTGTAKAMTTDSAPFGTDFGDSVKALQKANIHVHTNGSYPFVEEYVSYLRKFQDGSPMAEQEVLAKNHARIFDSYRRCLEYADEAEAAAQSKGDDIKTPYYDVFLRLQGDVGLQSQIDQRILTDAFPPPSNSIVVSECRSWNGMNDRLAIVSPDVARRYFQRPSQFLSKNEGMLDPGAARNPESFLLYLYTMEDIQILGHPLLSGVRKMFKKDNLFQFFKDDCPTRDPYRDEFRNMYGWSL